MAYATRQNIVDLYGEDALFAADRDGDGVTEDAAIDAALARASSEIDTYIGVRYELPLAANPDSLIQPCVDIALYRLAHDAAARSDEDRTRYEDAVKFLTRISKGEATLNLPPPGEGEPGADLEGPRPIVTSGPPRIFSRDETRGL